MFLIKEADHYLALLTNLKLKMEAMIESNNHRQVELEMYKRRYNISSLMRIIKNSKLSIFISIHHLIPFSQKKNDVIVPFFFILGPYQSTLGWSFFFLTILKLVHLYIRKSNLTLRTYLVLLFYYSLICKRGEFLVSNLFFYALFSAEFVTL